MTVIATQEPPRLGEKELAEFAMWLGRVAQTSYEAGYRDGNNAAKKKARKRKAKK